MKNAKKIPVLLALIVTTSLLVTANHFMLRTKTSQDQVSSAPQLPSFYEQTTITYGVPFTSREVTFPSQQTDTIKTSSTNYGSLLLDGVLASLIVVGGFYLILKRFYAHTRD